MINSSKIPSSSQIKKILSGIADRSKLTLERKDSCPAEKNALTGVDVTTSHRIGITWDGTTLKTTSEITVTRDADGSTEKQERYADTSTPTNAEEMEAYLTCMIRYRYFPI